MSLVGRLSSFRGSKRSLNPMGSAKIKDILTVSFVKRLLVFFIRRF